MLYFRENTFQNGLDTRSDKNVSEKVYELVLHTKQMMKGKRVKKWRRKICW